MSCTSVEASRLGWRGLSPGAGGSFFRSAGARLRCGDVPEPAPPGSRSLTEWTQSPFVWLGDCPKHQGSCAWGPRHSVISDFMRLAYSSLNASNTPVKAGNIVFI